MSLSQRVDQALPDLVFDSVRTDPLEVTPVFDRRSGVRITGYTGRYSARCTLADFTGLSDLVVALTSLPGAEVNGPQWSLRRDSALDQQARVAALRTAVARARDYAAALGATLGDLLDLSDADGGTPFAPMRLAQARAAEPAPDLDLEPQPQSARAHVVARFALTDVPASVDLPL